MLEPHHLFRNPRLIDSASALPAGSGFLSRHYLINYFGEARARRLLEDAGLAETGGSLPLRVGHVAFWQLCVDNILQTNDEAHGITKQPLLKSTWGTIYSAVNQMDIVAEGFKKFAELVSIVPADIDVTLGYSPSGIHVNFSLSRGGAASERGDRYLESVVLVFHCVLIWMTGEMIDPLQIRLSSLLEKADGTLLSCLGCPTTRRGSGLTIVYSRKDAELPLGVRKYTMWAAAETNVFLQLVAQSDRGPKSVNSRTAEALRRVLANNALSQLQAARAICLSTATLRRRLAEVGTTFREISKDVRREKLLSLLDSDNSLDDIAADLGFSDRRSLWRSCQEWLGMSPSAYRRGRFGRACDRSLS